MTTTAASALDGYKLDYEDLPARAHVIRPPKPYRPKTNYIKLYFNYLVEVILK